MCLNVRTILTIGQILFLRAAMDLGQELSYVVMTEGIISIRICRVEAFRLMSIREHILKPGSRSEESAVQGMQQARIFILQYPEDPIMRIL